MVDVTAVVSSYGGEVLDVVAMVCHPVPSSRCTFIEIKLPLPKSVLAVQSSTGCALAFTLPVKPVGALAGDTVMAPSMFDAVVEMPSLVTE